jgi:hypothetical protein
MEFLPGASLAPSVGKNGQAVFSCIQVDTIQQHRYAVIEH